MVTSVHAPRRTNHHRARLRDLLPA